MHPVLGDRLDLNRTVQGRNQAGSSADQPPAQPETAAAEQGNAPEQAAEGAAADAEKEKPAPKKRTRRKPKPKDETAASETEEQVSQNAQPGKTPAAQPEQTAAVEQ